MDRQPLKSGPIRTCVGCTSRRLQVELVRLCIDVDGQVKVGRSEPGRGAWLCAEPEKDCLSAAVERNALARAFRRKPDRSSVKTLVDSWAGQQPWSPKSS